MSADVHISCELREEISTLKTGQMLMHWMYTCKGTGGFTSIITSQQVDKILSIACDNSFYWIYFS